MIIEKIFIIFKQKSLVYVGSSLFYFLYRAFFSDMLKAFVLFGKLFFCFRLFILLRFNCYNLASWSPVIIISVSIFFSYLFVSIYCVFVLFLFKDAKPHFM
ncbi:uncharacterized protein BX663DRAFT_485844 [Cokeromyces recurvatus]|uniref:uncharacterized protein n=1 Tax=Cokeromyces recurvatus TaxID=90255 RepID=UPI00221EF6E5|nr:uncharacterized protein BX663DRAFT_485844 [Cokeromyces recurvatus]KAI7903743.1 hypothetical protein BX663DRAFT_485844 [Cokeromyces recurvatus]